MAIDININKWKDKIKRKIAIIIFLFWINQRKYSEEGMIKVKKFLKRFDLFFLLEFGLSLLAVWFIFLVNIFKYSYDLTFMGGTLIKTSLTMFQLIKGDGSYLIFNYDHIFNVLTIVFICLIAIDMILSVIFTKKRKVVSIITSTILLVLFVWITISFYINFNVIEDFYGAALVSKVKLNFFWYVLLLMFISKITLPVVHFIIDGKKRTK